jgi:DNA-binding CsgD family transcriptional regulator
MNREKGIVRTSKGYEMDDMAAVGLTLRESELLIFRAKGYSLKTCAIHMNCSINNVKHILCSLFYKTNTSSTPELITRTIQKGYLRFLTLVFAVLLGIFGNCLGDNHNVIARIGRTRTTQQLRIKRNSNNKQTTEIC